MAPKFLQVSPHIWTPAFRTLRKEHPDAFGLYLYLITTRHRGSEGLFWLPPSYMALDLGMSEDGVLEALSILEREGYVNYDHVAEVVLDRHALDYYEPKSPTQVKGAIRKIEEAPKTWLKNELVKLAFINAPIFADRIIEALPHLADTVSVPAETVSVPSAHSPDTTDTDTDLGIYEKDQELRTQVSKDAVDLASEAFGADVVRVVGDAT